MHTHLALHFGRRAVCVPCPSLCPNRSAQLPSLFLPRPKNKQRQGLLSTWGGDGGRKKPSFRLIGGRSQRILLEEWINARNAVLVVTRQRTLQNKYDVQKSVPTYNREGTQKLYFHWPRFPHYHLENLWSLFMRVFRGGGGIRRTKSFEKTYY